MNTLREARRLRHCKSFFSVAAKLLFIISCFFFNNCTAHALQPTFINGTVYNSYNSSLINNASITTLTGYTTKTSAGRFFLRVPPNVYTIIVSAPGYCSNMLTGILASPGQTVNISIGLPPASTESGYLEGRIFAAGSYKPVPNALVFTDLGGIGVTNDNGYFYLTSPSGYTSVTVTADAFVTKISDEILLEPGTLHNLVFYIKESLAKKVSTQGNIYNACTGARLNNATVLSTTGDIATTTNGSYSVPVSTGPATIVATAFHYQSAYTTKVITPWEMNDSIHFNLLPSENGYGLIYGFIIDKQSTDPIAYAKITSDTGTISFSNDSGAFLLYTSICCSSITVTKYGYTSSYLPILVSSNTKTLRNILLEPLSSISGLVYDSTDNHTVHNASLYIDELPMVQSTSNTNGLFLFDNIPQGTYTVTVTHDCYLPLSFSVSVEPGEIYSRNVFLEPTATTTLSGFITNRKTGYPIECAQVNTNHGSEALTDQNGFFSLTVPVCPTTITFSADHYITQKIQYISLLENDVPEIEIRLVPCFFCTF